MSATKVDVLGVLERAEIAAWTKCHDTQAQQEMEDARAAVGELIEASKEFRKYASATGTSAKINAGKRLDAAIARIGVSA